VSPADSEESAAGPARRAFIRNAALAGAAAWTAPVIIDSLASPAGALTLSGCYRFSIVPTTTGCTNAAIAAGAVVTCLATPGSPTCSGVTTVTTGTINNYCLTVTQGYNGNPNNCAPTFLQDDDTIIFGINQSLPTCDCPNATIEAAAGTFFWGLGTTCYASGGGDVTISGDKKSVTFGNPGIGNWTRYSFVIRCA